eukprot:TRINITY_DN11611_c0_g1_i1.p1 TRINITY_DN11611_c0_g1~~TRINITY_DN11611_c0_g1_i1.p1  ORF type:complete len:766 (+),score=199.42 TRINITY_DN11611_c0_g1_i1:96-2393(+)
MDLLERSEVPDDASLIAMTRDRIIENCLSAVKSHLKLLVLDDRSKKIMSSAVKMVDLTTAGISLLEKLELKRQPLPKMDAIYFITPSETSIKNVIKDFQDEDKPMYKSAHLFFTSHLPDAQMQRISQSKLAQHIETLVELNIDYVVREPRVFTTNQPGAFQNLYGPSGANVKAEQQRIAQKLLSFCATTGEFPVVRYVKSSPHSIAIAQALDEGLETLRQKGLLDPNEGDRPMLLITDRAHDLLTPFIHDFTYQAMVLDLLDDIASKYPLFVHKFVTQDDEEIEKEVLLDDTDPVWRTMAHMHIENGRQWVASTTREFVDSNKGGKGAIDKAKTEKGVKAIADLVKNVPKYQKLYSKFSIHIGLTKRCMEAFNRGGLEKVCEAEQAASTGGNTDNKKVETDQICKLVNACLEDPDIEHEDKVRLVMLLNAAVDHSDAKVRKTVQNARLSAGEEEALKHLISVKNVSGRKKQQRMPGKEEWEFDLSRYFPCVKDLYSQMVSGKLDVKEYPFISKDDEDKFGSASASSLTPAQSKRKDGGSTPASGSKWAQAGKSPATPAKSGKKGGGSINKYVIFIAGGVSYTEIREAYTKSASDKIQCYIGSTEIIRPSQFVELISKLGQPGSDDEPSSAPKRGGKSPRALDSDEESDEPPAKRTAKPSAAKSTAAKKTSTATSAKKAGSAAAKKRQESSEEDDDSHDDGSDDGSDESSDERPAKRVTAAKKAGSTSSGSTVKKAQPVAAKKAQPVKKATPAKKATRRRDDSDSD